MRFDSVVDALYVLGTLWGTTTGPQVCPTNPASWSRATPAVLWSAGLRAPGAVTAFVDVNVVPMDTERVLPNQTVLVKDGRITALGPVTQVQVPADAVRIDGRGKYLLPGLADMHWHDSMSEAQLQRTSAQDRVMSQIPGVFTQRDRLSSMLADGVTTVRFIEGSDEGGSVLDPKQARTYFDTATVLIPRPSLSPNLTGTTLDNVTTHIAAAKAAGYHHIGVGYRTSQMASSTGRQFFDSVLAAARRVGLSVAEHDRLATTRDLSAAERFELTLALGATSGSTEHLYAFVDKLNYPSFSERATALVMGGAQGAWDVAVPAVDSAALRALAAAARQAGLWVTPTLSCTEYKYLPPPAYTQVLRQVLKALHDAGVGLFLSADDGGNVHDELAGLVRAGLTPYQALATGTRNVAQYLRLLDSSGTVAVGKWADLMLLSGNPLQDIRHAREPVGVMLAGRWLDRATLDQYLLAAGFGFVPGNSIRMIPAINNLLTQEQRATFKRHLTKLIVLTESLAEAKSTPAAYEQVQRQLAEEFGAARALLPPDGQAAFDPLGRLWLREQARRGYTVTLPGLTPIP